MKKLKKWSGANSADSALRYEPRVIGIRYGGSFDGVLEPTSQNWTKSGDISKVGSMIHIFYYFINSITILDNFWSTFDQIRIVTYIRYLSLWILASPDVQNPQKYWIFYNN